ncbi:MULTISPECIES: DUF1294 domain-containing protein [Halocynthiibacter]|uniref:DUF1294 domain-containing protein n=1 Tax=Halocynthiibacter halioticoli TaxID=2986804 RepID=A0AAE3LUN2_9RHOB|nr:MULTISPECIES: DUF1294 domain-containing protein [Halocynthiibacter]MCV6824940.1 DUF1294 domain-containing protein [Halocynthiibacter halioticoli]MCW4057941.1 DUF1294 domain-containing protein [Halocynthiibacter sp. SDUM655004]
MFHLDTAHPEYWICLYFGAVSLLAFLWMGLDKLYAALGWRRIPERRLLFFGLIGGGAGTKLGQVFFRHKTRKEPMRSQIQRRLVWSVVLFLAFVIPQSREALIEMMTSATNGLAHLG